MKIAITDLKDYAKGKLAIYIDWDKYARNLFISDYEGEKLRNYKVAVFRRM